MSGPYNPNVAVQRNGRVVERATGREVGTVKLIEGAWVRRYKTVPARHYDGWEARTPGGATELFHHRHEAAQWLFERTRDRTQIRP